MEHEARIITLAALFLIGATFLCGCSDSSGQASPDTGLPAAVTTAAPRYAAGDIVRSTSGTDSPAWLVTGYDPADDSYSRALIYRNSDGSYGYRTSSATERTKREVMEKLYTVKITHVAVSSIPTSAPVVTTTVPPEETTAAPAGTIPAGTTTPYSTEKPSIRKMDPGEGEAGTIVKTTITGSDFLVNATAELRHSGESGIKANLVTFQSSSMITVSFDIPNSTRVGTWDIVVTNPNGLSGGITNYFLVHGNSTAG